MHLHRCCMVLVFAVQLLGQSDDFTGSSATGTVTEFSARKLYWGPSFSAGLGFPTEINERISEFLSENFLELQSGITDLGLYYVFGGRIYYDFSRKVSLQAGLDYSMDYLEILVENDDNHFIYYDRWCFILEPEYSIRKKLSMGLGVSYNHLNYREDGHSYSTGNTIAFRPELIFPLGMDTFAWGGQASTRWSIGLDLCRVKGDRGLILDYSMLIVGAGILF